MSRGNPKKAMAALLPFALKTSGGTVRPMTLGMWAALERIGSPLVSGKEPKDALELIPSLYLLTHDPREVFKGNILDLAMQWADTVPVSAMDEIKRACYRQMGAAFGVMPEIDPKKRDGRGNDGWIAALFHRTAAAYGWSYNDIMWEVPMSALVLLKRREAVNDKGEMTVYPLSAIEEDDERQTTVATATPPSKQERRADGQKA